jgi:4a-hydroxytetrahydrobiopterin dehydratase
VRDHHLRKTYKLRDFKSALAFVDSTGAAWGRVVVEIWTHKIDGLTESDFIFAAKCDRLFAA